MVILIGIQLYPTHLQVFRDTVLEAALCCMIHFVTLYLTQLNLSELSVSITNNSI